MAFIDAPAAAKIIPDYGLQSNIIFSDHAKAISVALTITHETYIGLGDVGRLGRGRPSRIACWLICGPMRRHLWGHLHWLC
jgi:hypothetical protein